MPTNTDPAAVTDMARRREATTFHGDEAQFWVFDLADGGRVHIPPDQVRRLWNAEQLQQQLKGCECPARKALQRMMDEHGHDCDCIPMVLCEYCEGRAAISAPCPCEGLRADEPSAEAWKELVRWAHGADRSQEGVRLIYEITTHYLAMRRERDSLRAELAELRAFKTAAMVIFDELAEHIAGAELEGGDNEQRLEAELAASQERERLLGEQLEFDRTALADAITGIKKAFDSRFWLTEGRGSYEWDDDRYRSEFRETYQEINLAIGPLKKIAADWTGCPRKAEEVAQARIDLKQRAEAAEERERLLRNAVDRLWNEFQDSEGISDREHDCDSYRNPKTKQCEFCEIEAMVEAAYPRGDGVSKRFGFGQSSETAQQVSESAPLARGQRAKESA